MSYQISKDPSRERIYKILALNDKHPIDMDPLCQRDFCWKAPKKAEFIRSLRQGYQVLTPIWLAETEDGALVVVDGKQRLSAILEYVDSEAYATLPAADKKRFQAIELYVGELNAPTELARYEAFKKLNSTAVKLKPFDFWRASRGIKPEVLSFYQTFQAFDGGGNRKMKDPMEWALKVLCMVKDPDAEPVQMYDSVLEGRAAAYIQGFHSRLEHLCVTVINSYQFTKGTSVNNDLTKEIVAFLIRLPEEFVEANSEEIHARMDAVFKEWRYKLIKGGAQNARKPHLHALVKAHFGDLTTDRRRTAAKLARK